MLASAPNKYLLSMLGRGNGVEEWWVQTEVVLFFAHHEQGDLGWGANGPARCHCGCWHLSWVESSTLASVAVRLHGLSKALSPRMLYLNGKTVIFKSQQTRSHLGLCPQRQMRLSGGLKLQMEIVLQGRRCFNSVSNRCDTKKNIQEAFYCCISGRRQMQALK